MSVSVAEFPDASQAVTAIAFVPLDARQVLPRAEYRRRAEAAGLSPARRP